MPHSYKEISPGISWGLTNVIMPNCLFVLKSYFEAFTFCSQVISKNNAFFLFFKNWTIVALQYYVSFCCKPKGISHKRTSLSPGAPSSHCRPSHPRVQHRAWLWAPVPHSSFPLAICFTLSGVQMSVRLSQYMPVTPSHPVPTSPFSTTACPFLPCK